MSGCYLLEFFSNERWKGTGSGKERRWGGTGKSKKKENCNHDINTKIMNGNEKLGKIYFHKIYHFVMKNKNQKQTKQKTKPNKNKNKTKNKKNPTEFN